MRQYLKAGLLDEMQIHLIPVLLGGGIHTTSVRDGASIANSSMTLWSKEL